MSDFHRSDWDNWGTLWRRDDPEPLSQAKLARLARRRRPAAVVATTVSTVAHGVVVYWLASSVTGSEAVLLGMRVLLLASVLFGARELVRRFPWERPSGYDALSVHLERMVLAVEASATRLRRLLVVLTTLALVGGPVTWAAWTTLDGDSAIPYLPKPVPSLWLGVLAAVYGVVVALRMAHVGRLLAGLRQARHAADGDSDPAPGGAQ